MRVHDNSFSLIQYVLHLLQTHPCKSMAAFSSFYSLRLTPLVRALAPLRITKLKYPVPRSQSIFHSPPQIQRINFSTHATNDKEAKAKAAAVNSNTGAPTIFDKIISKESPAAIVYEDEKVLAFRDINPQAPVHVIVIPRIRDGLTELGKAELKHEDILGHLLYATKIVAEKEGIVDGFRVVINSGSSACQLVYHIHLHVLGGRQMKWPPG